MYYLQSRYYNPEWGRFINADALVSTGQGLLGNNMFAYCNNNPVNSYDPSGLCGLCFCERLDDQFSFAQECGRGTGGRTTVGTGVIVLPVPFELVEDTAELVISAVNTLTATKQERTHHVYKAKNTAARRAAVSASVFLCLGWGYNQQAKSRLALLLANTTAKYPHMAEISRGIQADNVDSIVLRAG